MVRIRFDSQWRWYSGVAVLLFSYFTVETGQKRSTRLSLKDNAVRGKVARCAVLDRRDKGNEHSVA